MNKVLMSLLFSAFVLTGNSFAQSPTPAESPAAVPSAVAAPTEEMKPAHHSHHPELIKARRKLRGAKDDLLKAAHDYGGHKAKAVEDIDEALHEIQAALDYEKSK